MIDIKERGPDENADAARPGTRRELSPELNGLVLMQKLNCVACHKSESLNSIIASKKAPRLDWSGARLNPAFIQRFVAALHTMKPGATMPDVLGHLDETTRQKTAEAITHFLVSKTENNFKSQPVAQDSIKPGFRLFHSVGCVACHAPRNEDGVELEEQPREDDSIPLGDLSRKFDVSGLVAFLENPLAVRSSGHMPGMKLSRREAIELSSYLLQSAGIVEIKEIKATLQGFDISFTKPVMRQIASNPETYQLKTFTHLYRQGYGSPEVDQTSPVISKATVSADGLRVNVEVENRVQGHVHDFHLPDMRSAEHEQLLHSSAYYTLNEIPKETPKPKEK